MVDPQCPMRVWAKGQSFGSTDGIDIIFLLIYMFQMLIIAAVVSTVLGERGSKVRIAPTSTLYVIPMLIEIFLLLVLGLTLYQG